MKNKLTMKELDQRVNSLCIEQQIEWYPVRVAEDFLIRHYLSNTGQVRHFGRYHLKQRRDYRNRIYPVFTAFIRTKVHLSFLQPSDRDWGRYEKKVIEAFIAFEIMTNRRKMLTKINNKLKI